MMITVKLPVQNLELSFIIVQWKAVVNQNQKSLRLATFGKRNSQTGTKHSQRQIPSCTACARGQALQIVMRSLMKCYW